VNCGGSHWQMELWIPKRNVPTAYGYWMSRQLSSSISRWDTFFPLHQLSQFLNKWKNY
jgi:hypothetical protein